ncbi:MAG: hypothetical protein A3B68_08590 [Candidatus Melainabacteria bacterium RIFCSPHIGHO2_02_FULL_34_12]|nr:MAG: hypothetical protein A3B68_08590 [Candidatus Melainabacteria bacterium RIFCSPHIGHO2_02_FULL_34_12]
MQIISLILVTITFLLQGLYISANSQTLLKGGVRTVIQKGQVLEINLSTPINFYFSQEGDKVAAFLREDIVIGKNFYIPKGSRLDGIVTAVNQPKNFGRDGSFEIDFNEIITPGGQTIPIYASVSTDISKSLEKVADILTYDAALVAYGSVHGLVAGLQYGGIPLAVASHGISLLAGSSVGAGAGVIGSAVRKGKIPRVLNSINIPVTLKNDFYVFGETPAVVADTRPAQENEYKGFRFFRPIEKNEINLLISKINNKHSKTYGDYVIVEFKIQNNSKNPISLSDFILINKKNDEVLHADLLLSGNDALKIIYPSTELNASLAFIASYNEKDFLLALLDSLDRSEVLKIPLKEQAKD